MSTGMAVQKKGSQESSTTGSEEKHVLIPLYHGRTDDDEAQSCNVSNVNTSWKR